MRGLMNRRTGRLLAVSAAALITAGATLGGAQAASLPTPQINGDCSPVNTSLVFSGNEVEALFDQACTQPGGATTYNEWPVNLSQLVNGAWVVIASGDGVAAHLCVGTTEYEYHGANNTTGTFACG
jgi:hypothetical protein